MAHILVFGANSAVGEQLVPLALEQGHNVRVFLSKKNDWSLEANNLEVVRGRLLNLLDVNQAFSQVDAVFITVNKKMQKRAFFRAGAAKNIMDAMRRNAVERLIAQLPYGPADVTAHQIIDNEQNFALPNQTEQPVTNSQYYEAAIESSALDWTTVRTANIIDGPRTNAYNVAQSADLSQQTAINSGDVADFMLKCFEDKLYIKENINLLT